MEFLKKNASAIGLCVVELILGVLLIVHSESFIKVLSIVAGSILIVGGVLFTIMYFASRTKGTEGKYLFNGLTYIAVGIVLIVKYGMWYAALDFLFVILALILLMGGFEMVQEVCDKIRAKQGKWLATLIGALIQIVLGILVLVLDETKWLFITIGIIVIVDAVYNLCVMIFLNDVHNTIKEAAEEINAAESSTDAEQKIDNNDDSTIDI